MNHKTQENCCCREKSTVENLKDKAEELGSEVSRKTGEVADSVKTTAHKVAHCAREMAANAAGGISHAAAKAEKSLRDE